MTIRLLEIYNITSNKKNFFIEKKYKKSKNFILQINNNYSTSLDNKLKNFLDLKKTFLLLIENQNRTYYSKINSYGHTFYSPYEFFHKDVILLLNSFIIKNNIIDIKKLLLSIYNININFEKIEIPLHELTRKAINISQTVFNTPIISKEILLYTIFDYLKVKKGINTIYNLIKYIYSYENILKTHSHINNLYINYLIYKEVSKLQWENILNEKDLFSTFSTIPLFVSTQLQYKALEIENILFFNIIKKYI